MYVYVCIYIHKHRLRTDVLNLADNTKPIKVNKAEGKQEETPFKTDNATMKKDRAEKCSRNDAAKILS